ncbi:MAG: outer membrane protein assembly factor BamD [bacterium]|nr:outer membrane protein assembly factor BamD [bacterium]
MKKKNGATMVFLAVLVSIIMIGCATTGNRWQEANQLGTIESYEAFLRQYPNSEYSSPARSKLAALYEQRDWNRAQQQNTIAAYERFLVRYPGGANAKEANSKLEKLYYDNARAKDDLNAYANFLRRYPNSVYKNSILLRAEAIWFESAKSKNTVAAYSDFLRRFPNSVYAREAKAWFEKINEIAVKERERLARIAAEERERLARLAAEKQERLAREAREEQERIAREWEKALAANTAAVYKEFLDRNPKSKFAREAAQYLAIRNAEGWIKKIDKKARRITIKTSMGKQETFLFDSDTKVNKKNASLSLKDLKNDESVMIKYNSLPGKAISKSILLGYSVSHCSCGSNCSCPLSRGCRVIRY